MFEAKIIEDSVSEAGVRLTTMQLVYPRYIHSEFLTHRTFSRNASSTRAIPVVKAADLALSEMVEPIRYGKNKRGMQASEENLTGPELERAQEIWRNMAEICANGAKELAELGLHKQWSGRSLEWFSNIRVIVTATEWENFFELRHHCYSEDTEVLTLDGWKLLSDVRVGEKVITLNKDTRKVEQTDVIETVCWESEGVGVALSGQSVDLIVSHGHQQLVEVDGKLTLKKASELLGSHPTLYKTCMPDNYDPTSQEYMFGRLLGFYLGNGWTAYNKTSGNYDVVVCKGGPSGPRIICEYERITGLIFPTVRKARYERANVEHLTISGKDVYDIFSNLGLSTTKRIPPQCWTWSASSLRGIFDGMMDADSNIHAKSGGLKYYTSSKELADDMQRLSLLVGFSASIGIDNRIGGRSRGVSPITGIPYDIVTKNICYRVSINLNRNSPRLKHEVREVEYFGKFVCLKLQEHHTLYVRRSGKTVWSGNCDAQPEIFELAKLMRQAMDNSQPNLLKMGEWHLPYVSQKERAIYPLHILKKLSTARSARVSFLNHDGSSPDIDKDCQLYERLVGSRPLHASPVEHVATPLSDPGEWSGNFRGWFQHRKEVERLLWQTK